MDETEMLAGLRAVAVEILEVDPDTVTPDTLLREDLGAESLDLIDFVMALEDRFMVRFALDDLESVRTVGQALDLVRAALARAAQPQAQTQTP